MKVERQIEICCAHRLFDYNGKCENLHGHNYIVTLSLENYEPFKGDRNGGMFIDFAILKEFLKAVDEAWDHKTMLYHLDPLADYLIKAGMKVVLCKHNPTAENMVYMIAEMLHRKGIFLLKSNQVGAFTISVEETRNNTASQTFYPHDFKED